MGLHPSFLADGVVGVEFASQVSEVLARVIEIDDLDRAGKRLFGQIPDPLGAIAHDDPVCRAAPVALPGLHVWSFAELLGGFNGAGVSSGFCIADGVTLLVPARFG